MPPAANAVPVTPVMPIPPLPLLVLIAGIAAGRLLRAWLRHRGARAILCPENLRPAGVRVNARHAALTGFAYLAGAEDLDRSRCKLRRWKSRPS